MKWAPEYVQTVLKPGFDMMKRDFVIPMITISMAHVVMLEKTGILEREESGLILQSCQKLLNHDWSSEEYPGDVEDLFFLIEKMIEQDIGPNAAGNMHMAMSRNDLDTALFRWVLREEVLELGRVLIKLRQVISTLALRYAGTIMPAHTHNQQAQPTTLGHYLAAVEANFARDHQRLLGLYKRINCSPLGACALATTAFPIDREYIAELLGFDGLVENSYDAICTVDYMAETVGFLGSCLTTISRFVADLLLWATNEFDVIRLSDQYVQGSSIMPQKRNPVGLEHVRSHTGRTIGKLSAFYSTVKGVPFGDVNDAGPDIQPIMREVCGDSAAIIRLLTGVLESMEVNERLLFERASKGFSAITELADNIARNGHPFRVAHKIAASVVAKLSKENRPLTEITLTELDSIYLEITGSVSGLTEETLRQVVDPVFFVESRSVIGGPSLKTLVPYLERSQKKAKADFEKIQFLSRNLDKSAEALNSAISDVIEGR